MWIRETLILTLIAFAAQEYSKSIDKSKDIMEHFINLLREEGVTTVPLWTEPQGVPNIQENAQENKVGARPRVCVKIQKGNLYHSSLFLWPCFSFMKKENSARNLLFLFLTYNKLDILLLAYFNIYRFKYGAYLSVETTWLHVYKIYISVYFNSLQVTTNNCTYCMSRK